jgi:hypothetical protein
MEQKTNDMGDIMKIRNFSIKVGIVTAALIFGAFGGEIYGQGQGRGGGRPANAGPPTGNPGVDRGLGAASDRSNGRSDNGLGTAAQRSNGRSMDGLDRAKLARHNASAVRDSALRRYSGLSRRLGTTPAEMRSAYEAALLVNPDLKFGQFVAANMIAENLNSRHPAVTSSAILAGLANGDSMGRTLRNLGLGSEEAKSAERAAKERMKAAGKNN